MCLDSEEKLRKKQFEEMTRVNRLRIEAETFEKVQKEKEDTIS